MSMVAEVINLRRARKAKLRAGDAAKASANRAAHGRTRAEKQRAKVVTDRLEKALDGAKRE